MWECGGGGDGESVYRCELSVGVSGYGEYMDENKEWSDVCVCVYVCGCVHLGLGVCVWL